jgi:phage gp36-like protein
MPAPYCASADIEKRLPTKIILKLCDDEDLVTDFDGTLAAAIVENPAIDTRISDAIEEADSEVNIYLRKRFAPPVEDSAGNTPDSVKKLSIDLSIYYLHMRRQSEMDAPPQVLRRYERSIAILEGINKGTIDLGVEPQPTKSEAIQAESIDASDVVTTDRLFTPETLKDF